MAESDFTTHVTNAGQWTVLVLGSDLTHVNESKIEEGREALSDAVEKAREATESRLLIDMSGCKFFGSSFIEALFQTWKKLEADGGKFAVCGCNADVREVFQVTRLDNVWSIYETRDEAVAATA